MNKLYRKTIDFVDKSFGRKRRHFERTVHWLLQLRPDVSDALKIAAYSHDIHRAFARMETMKKITDSQSGFLDPDMLKQHQEEGGHIVKEFLLEQGASDQFAQEVYDLISKHEVGGTPEQDLLKDADSISYFECNADKFIEKYVVECGFAKINDKFVWMYERITSPKAKKIAEPMYQSSIKKLKANT